MKKRSRANRLRRMAAIYIRRHRDLLQAISWASLYVAWIVMNMQPIIYTDTVV